MVSAEVAAFSEHLRQEPPHASDSRHDTDENVAARTCHPAQLGDRVVGSIHRIADGSSEAHHGVEPAVFDAGEITDVEPRASDDCVFPTCGLHPLGIEPELNRREVADVHTRADLRELDGEPPRAGTGVEDEIARSHELGEQTAMDRETRTRGPVLLVTVPLTLRVHVEVLRCVLRIVRERHRRSLRNGPGRSVGNTETSCPGSARLRLGRVTVVRVGCRPCIRVGPGDLAEGGAE